MTNEEFSLEFDILYNNISSNQAPGLTEYEKSVFLTQAQEALVLDIYSGKLGVSFETTEETTSYLASLVEQIVFDSDLLVKDNSKRSFNGDSYIVSIPDNTKIWFKTGELAVITSPTFNCKDNNKTVEVVPVTQDNWYRIVTSPFKGPNDRRVLRMSFGENNSDIELFSKYPMVSYTVRYMRKPNPIILDNLEEGLEIEGINVITQCELHEALHRAILQKAVSAAKAVWTS